MSSFSGRLRGGWMWAAGGALAGILVLVAMLILTSVARGDGPARAQPVVTVLPRPTFTSVVVIPPTSTPTETPAPAVSREPGTFGVGGLVEVYGTEGDGLRLRQEPSTAGTIKLLAGESEVFIIQDGPVQADDRAWFYLVSPSDSTRAGWAVADFLRPAQ